MATTSATGETPLQRSEWCDDQQTINIFVPNAKAIVDHVLWVPDRTVVIDAVQVYADTYGTVLTYQLMSGIGPFGATGADADVAAVLVADRELTAIVDIDALTDAQPYEFTLGDVNSNHTYNKLSYGYTDTSGNSGLRDVLVVEAVGSGTGFDTNGAYWTIRYRSKVR